MLYGTGTRFARLLPTFLALAGACAAGCTGKDKNDGGLRALDPKTKAALIGQTDSSMKPKPKFAVGDPNQTGAKDVTVAGSFDRRVVNPNNPETPGSLASNSSMPVQPSGGLPQPKPIEQVRYDAPPVRPLESGPLPKPMMPLASVPEPLQNPLPSDVPAPAMPPIIPVGSAPMPSPPGPPVGMPSMPEPGLIPIPSPNEKPIPGFPIVPPAVK